MNLEDIKKLINSVIENEFRHISQYEECEDFNADIEIKSLSQEINVLLKQLSELLPEHKELILDLESKSGDYTTAACRYYFKKGVIAGATNLKFLESTQIIEYI